MSFVAELLTIFVEQITIFDEKRRVITGGERPHGL